jgi:hypothetical protein
VFATGIARSSGTASAPTRSVGTTAVIRPVAIRALIRLTGCPRWSRPKFRETRAWRWPWTEMPRTKSAGHLSQMDAFSAVTSNPLLIGVVNRRAPTAE